MSEEIKLLACPFCGGAASVTAAPLEHLPKDQLVSGRDRFSTGYWVGCDGKCGIMMGHQEGYTDCDGGDFSSAKEAADAWNSRV